MENNYLWPNLTENPFGIYIAHAWNEIGALFQAIDRYQVKTFIEIGTHRGGLSYFLIQRAKNVSDFIYLGVEINPDLVDARVINEIHLSNSGRASIYFGDAFEQHTIVEVMSHFRQGVALVYCDGGNKPKEVQTFAPLLRPGDLIAAHDYGDEIQFMDVLPLCRGDFEICLDEWLSPTRILMLRKRLC